MESLVFWLFVGFLTKHFICDFPLQADPYQYLNKGDFRHPGGYVHAAIHVSGTLFTFGVLLIVLPGQIVAPLFHLKYWLGTIAVFEGAIHYLIDWAKVNIKTKMNWGPLNSEWFWILLGADQYLHGLTYCGMIWYITR